MRFVCTHCSGKFVLKRYRIGTLMFCSRTCKRAWQHKLKEFERARNRYYAYLGRAGP